MPNRSNPRPVRIRTGTAWPLTAWPSPTPGAGVCASALRMVMTNRPLISESDLKLMEREGSGYDRMYEALLSTGRPAPVVKEGDDRGRVVAQQHRVARHGGVSGVRQQNAGFGRCLYFSACSYGYISRKIKHGRFCSSRCPASCPPTRGRVSRRQAHAAWLPLRTHDQVQQTRLRLRERSQGSSRSLSQPHACRRRQDALPLPH